MIDGVYFTDLDLMADGTSEAGEDMGSGALSVVPGAQSPQSPAPRPSKKRRKKRGWIKWVVIAGILAAVGGRIYYTSKNITQNLYQTDTAALRDIRTFHSFTGTVAPITSRDVTSTVNGVKISEVLVKEGDDVKEGDLLMVLDTSSLDEQILERQASIDAASYSSSLSVQSALNSYNNLKNNLDAGMETSVMNAKNQMDSAYANLVSAQQAFNDEVALNNDQMSSTILNAKQSVDSAYDALQSRILATTQARERKAKNEKDAADSGMPYDPFSDDQAIETAVMSEQQAWNSYNQAQQKFEQAKINEENNLTKLFDQVQQAQNSYLSSIDSYNAAVNASQQQLRTYEMQVQQARAQANDSVNRLQLEDLKSNLDDYAVYAPISGEVITLKAHEGDILSATSGALATIVDFDRMKIDIKIGEYDILGASEGEPVTITIDALNKDYPGQIVRIARIATVENGVSYYEAEVDFDTDDDIRSGMSAEVRLTVNDLSNVVTVLSEAIQTADDGTAYVLVDGEEPNSKINWPVTLGASDGTYTQITNGLSAGESVYYTSTPSFIPGGGR